MRVCGVISLTLLLWIFGSEARFGIDYHAKAAYFNFEVDGESQYVFCMNAVANGDVYFHMSGPVKYSWLGVGIGNEMRDSFMIIAYPSSNGLNTTISTRIATGHNEPTYTPDFEIIKVYNDTYAPAANTVTDDGTGTIIAHAMCRNCSQWATGFLDTRNKEQPLIFALGPAKRFREDSPEASIPRHGTYGRYTMDMTQATNYSGWYGRVPAPNDPDFVFPPSDIAFNSAGTSLPFDVENLDNPLPTVHGVLMCIAFVLIFPAGAVVMHLLRKTLAHAATQVLGLVFVLAGFGAVIQIARQYNKSKDFNSAHQVIGLIILAGLIIQLGLGLVHHSTYVRTNKPTPMGRIHFFLGPFIMVLGLINAGVGFDFAGNSHMNVPYAVIVVVIALIIAAVIGFQTFSRGRRKYKPETEGYQLPREGHTDHEMIRQPTFGEQPPAPYEPTTPYTPTDKFTLASPYSPSSPYTPSSAYTPITPKTWKKEGITNWPLAPHREYGQ